MKQIVELVLYGIGVILCVVAYVRIIWKMRQEELWVMHERNKPIWLINVPGRRKLSELLIILRDSLSSGGRFKDSDTGLCGEVSVLKLEDKITWDEAKTLRDFIYENKPTSNLHPEFFTDRVASGESYWWIPMKWSDTGRVERIKFVEKLIFNVVARERRNKFSII